MPCVSCISCVSCALCLSCFISVMCHEASQSRCVMCVMCPEQKDYPAHVGASVTVRSDRPGSPLQSSHSVAVEGVADRNIPALGN